MNKICRTCLNVIKSGSQIFRLDIEDVILQIRTKLEKCAPEIILERVRDPVICELCFNSLNAAYAFKTRCQQTEAKIYECITRLQTPCIDLNVFIPPDLPVQGNSDEQISEPNTTNMPIKCKVCEECFVSHDLLKEHVMAAHPKAYQCKICDVQNTSESELNEHMQLHISIPASVPQFYQTTQNPEVYQCVDCPFSSSDVNLLREHKAVHSSERLYHCSICSFSSTHQSSIKRHTKIHEKPFKCSECKYQTMDKMDLLAHMQLHSGQQFKCNYCPYFSLKRSNLRRHRVRNHPDKILPNSIEDDQVDLSAEQSDSVDPYKVSISDIESILLDDDDSPTLPPNIESSTSTANDEESFDVTVDDIQQILQNGHHVQDGSVTPGNVEQNNIQNPVFKCPTCPETFKFKYLLRKHVSIHSADKLFECPECGLRTKTKVHLQGHMKTHGSEIVYTCDKCEYTSMYWGSMQKHNILHTGEKPFKCPLCSYRGTYQSTVKYHMSTHSKPYCCNECSFVTNGEAELFNHMEVHASQNQARDTDVFYNFMA